MASSKITLKLLIDKKKQRVLFAEAGKDFVDFLFSLLALPVGTVIKLLNNNNIEGGLTNLYKSVSDLNDDFIQSNQNKDVLLNPKGSLPFVSSQLHLLSIKTRLSSPSSTPATTLYKCGKCNGRLRSTHISYCSVCKGTMLDFDDDYVLKSEMEAKGGGFVKGLVTYMVMDDLTVSPLSTISNITLLNKFNIKDLGGLEEKVAHIGMNEGLQILKHSLISKTVLTDAFLAEVVAKDDNLKKV